MGNFNDSYLITAKTEGGYNHGVGEKETYMGIDRGANPKWSGWAVIDSLKPFASTKAANAILSQNKEMQANIINFYLANYWNVLSLSKIASQAIANTTYDCSVNQGSGIAGKFLQMAVNYAIGIEKSAIGILVVDGQIGEHTITAVNALPAEIIYNEINTLREARYHATVQSNPAQKEWLGELGKSGWLGRLTQYTA